ncbi:MAG: primase-helicase zinc-binding domain-containing protein [Chloroflexota bacterium]
MGVGRAGIMIDVQTLKSRIDLLSLAQRLTELGRIASTGGGEWAGPCPFCGGKDRFRVQPNHQEGGRWMCRQCTDGKWQDAISFVMRRDNCDFKTACAALSGNDMPTTSEIRRQAPAPAAAPTDDDDWQLRALRVARVCKANLWTAAGAAAVDYLLDRGLSEQTLLHYHVGFSPGGNIEGMYIPRGVVIPCIVAGAVWYLKIALLPGDPIKCSKCGQAAKARQACPKCGEVNKYRGVKGNRTAAIFGAGDLTGEKPALFCEGEIDAMTAYQEAGDLVTVATAGAATNHPDLAAWGIYLMQPPAILAVYDQDQAGQKGAAYLTNLSSKVQPCALPAGAKDINAFFCDGGDLHGWLQAELTRRRHE